MATSPTGSPAPRSWRDAAKAGGKGRPRPSRRRTFFWLAAAFLAVAGLFVVVITRIKPPPPRPDFVPLFITEHTSTGIYLPVNAQARGDLQAMVGGDNPCFGERAKILVPIQELKSLRRELDELKNRPPKDPVVVYLSGAVACDAEGKLYLLPGDADVDDAGHASWLPLQDIYHAVENCPSTRKLLVLDIMQPIADARLGVLANDAAERVEKLFKSAPYWVLCACSPGQTSLGWEEQHRSVFNYYFEQGVRGWSDVTSKNGRHDVVKVKDLADYVQTHVDRWAERCRRNRQTPVLWGQKGDDFPLRHLVKGEPRLPAEPEADTAEAVGAKSGETEASGGAKNDAAGTDKAKPGANAADSAKDGKSAAEKDSPSKGPAETATPPKSKTDRDAYPRWLEQAWKKRDTWWRERTYVLAPRILRQLEDELLRAEQHWRGGSELSQTQRHLQDKLAEYEARLSELRASVPQPGKDKARSLALAIALGRDVKPEVQEAARSLQALLDNLPPEDKSPAADKPAAAPAAGAETKSEGLAKFLEQFEKKSGAATVLKDPTGFDFSLALFQAALGHSNLNRPRLDFLVRLLDKHAAETEFVEIIFLRRLQALSSGKGNSSAGLTAREMQQALRLVEAAERAQALASSSDPAWEPRAYSWLKPLLEEAAQKRHDGEVLLFARGYASLKDADTLLENALEQVERVNKHLEDLHLAYRAYDQAVAMLPGYISYLAESENFDSRIWKECLSLVEQLYNGLSRPPDWTRGSAELDGLATRIGDLKATAGRLLHDLDVLSAPFTKDLGKFIETVRSSEAKPDQYKEAQARLKVPWLTADDRRALWLAMHDLGLELGKNAPAVDQQAAPLSSVDDDRERAKQAENAKAAWRAEVTLDLFQLGGVSAPALGAWRGKLVQARKTPPAQQSADWPALGQGLRQLWKELAQPRSAASLSAWTRDRLSRAYHPLDVPDWPKEAQAAPGLEMQRAPAQTYWRWLADRYQYESRELAALGINAAISEFYSSAAERYLQYVPFKDRPVQSYVQFATASERPGLRPDKPSADYEVTISSSDLTTEAAVQAPQVLKPDEDWLDVQQTESRTASGKALPISLHIRLKPTWETTNTPSPEGFLVRAQLDGRSYHYRVALDTPAASQNLQLILSKQPEPAKSISELRLRPKEKQDLYVLVRNTGDQPRTLFVEMEYDGRKLRTKEQPFPKGDSKPLVFEDERPVALDKPLAPGLGLPALRDRVVHFRLFEHGPQLLKTLALSVDIRSLSDYLHASPPKFEPGEKNRLSISVHATDALAGPCPIKLMVLPDGDSGTIRVEGSSRLLDNLGPGHDKAELFADGLQFEDLPGNNARVAISADGYEQAFVYRITLAARGDTVWGNEILVPFLDLRPEVTTPPTASYLLPLQVFSSNRDVAIQVETDFTGNGAFARLPLFKGAYQRRIGFSPASPTGALQFDAGVEPVNIVLSTAGLQGPYKIRARLLDMKERPLTDYKEATLKVDGKAPDEKDLRFVSVNDVKVSASGDGGAASVRVPRAKRLLFKVAGGEASLSGIKDVQFYQGAPENGQPPKATPVAAVSHDKNQWQAALSLNGEPSGPTSFTAQFVNGVNMATLKTITVDFETPESTPRPTTGSIKVTVQRAGNPRPGVDVVLEDGKGGKIKEKTDNNGEFIFRKLTPGKYQVSSSDFNVQSDKESIEVTAGNESATTLELKIK